MGNMQVRGAGGRAFFFFFQNVILKTQWTDKTDVVDISPEKNVFLNPNVFCCLRWLLVYVCMYVCM
jgi:hypothetical protein